jgi:hypothetical protein
MKSKWLFTLATILVFLGVISLIISWHGTMSVTGAFPTNSSSVMLTGAATGGWAVLGLLSLLGGMALLIVSVVRAFTEPFRRTPARPAVPPTPIRTSPTTPSPSGTGTTQTGTRPSTNTRP